ncbi:MAG: HU family DNA-binding protein, partial [Bacteroides sp.]|nr:HU family DNA-binding protein [Bacteroides sp.]
MAINYYVLERKVPAGPDKGKMMQYAQVRSGSVIGFEAICRKIALLSTATSGDVKVVLNGLLTVISEYLGAGHRVQVGSLGNFRPSAGSRPAREETEVTAHLMKQPKIIFSPGKALRKMLNGLSFRRMENPV